MNLMRTSLVIILIFISGCASGLKEFNEQQKRQVNDANGKIAATLARECATTRLEEGEGLKIPELGRQNAAYRVQCLGNDGLVHVIWFTRQGNVDLRSTYK